MDPSVLPGWAYSRALALWMSEDAKKDKVSRRRRLIPRWSAIDPLS